MEKKVIPVRVKRQDSPESAPYMECFDVEYSPNMTVIDVLLKIQRAPVTREGKTVTPVVWDCNCLEEVCGACAMRICGVPRLACSAKVDELLKKHRALTLEPFSKFPVVRDLAVDRSSLNAKYLKYRVYVDPSAKKEYPKQKDWGALYPYTRCINCGTCIEACPNTGTHTDFIGAAPVGRLRYLLEKCTDRDQLDEHLDPLKDKGGISVCSGHSLCLKYCPKSIDLPAAFGRLNGQMNTKMFRRKKKGE